MAKSFTFRWPHDGDVDVGSDAPACHDDDVVQPGGVLSDYRQAVSKTPVKEGLGWIRGYWVPLRGLRWRGGAAIRQGWQFIPFLCK